MCTSQSAKKCFSYQYFSNISQLALVHAEVMQCFICFTRQAIELLETVFKCHCDVKLVESFAQRKVWSLLEARTTEALVEALSAIAGYEVLLETLLVLYLFFAFCWRKRSNTQRIWISRFPPENWPKLQPFQTYFNGQKICKPNVTYLNKKVHHVRA